MLEFAILTICIAVSLYVGVLTVLARPDSHTNRIFAVFVITTVLWLAMNYISSQTLEIVWLRLVMFFAAAQVSSLFLFVHTFPSRKVILKPKQLTLFYIIGAAVHLLTLTPLVYDRFENGQAIVGYGIPFFGIYALGLLAAIVYLLIRKTLASRGVIRSQMRNISLGIISTFSFIAISNFVLVAFFRNTSFVAFAPLAALFLFGIISYKILTQQLFDVRLIIKRTLIFTLLLLFIFAVYGAVLLVFVRGFSDFYGSYSTLISFIEIVVIGLTFNGFREWAERRADLWLFRDQREREELIHSLNEQLNQALDLHTALDTIANHASRSLRSELKRMVAYIFQTTNELTEQQDIELKELYYQGYPNAAGVALDKQDGFISYFSKHQSSIFVDDLLHEVEQEKVLIATNNLPQHGRSEFIRQHALKNAVYSKLSSLHASVAMPLYIKNNLIGLIVLSTGSGRIDLSRESLEFLNQVSAQSVAGIQKANLYQVDQLKTEFVSIASHELRTPLTAIRGYLSMIVDEKIAGQELSAEKQEYLTRVFSIAKQLASLVNDLLTVSRIESGKMEIKPEPMQVLDVVRDCLTAQQRAAAAVDVTLHLVEPRHALPQVLIDASGCKEVISNLLANAVSYNKKHGTVTVSFKHWQKEREVEITITDTGIGMSKEKMRHLFERFYRVETPETTGISGTGLGLYICKLVMEKMGGTITAESTEKRGSTFRVYVPVVSRD